MRDPYAWIDPFAEIERHKRIASNAREDGRNEISSWIEREHGDELPKAIERSAYCLAERLAVEFLEPHLRDHRMEYDQYQRRLELEIESNMHVMQPAIFYAQHDGALEFRFPDQMAMGIEPHVSYATKQPFRYSVTMSPSPSRWRR